MNANEKRSLGQRRESSADVSPASMSRTAGALGEWASRLARAQPAVPPVVRKRKCISGYIALILSYGTGDGEVCHAGSVSCLLQ